jgi:hypothetical protein
MWVIANLSKEGLQVEFGRVASWYQVKQLHRNP